MVTKAVVPVYRTQAHILGDKCGSAWGPPHFAGTLQSTHVVHSFAHLFAA